ncbi:uncharacterized protein LOC109859075 [Pseudomyrmex gracilis]|uniref:uncharacterized protein LOC109859075 n=1 Tax=Pseudomyrmex gracilis TaxID=219809 RepID=UPI0009949964|nr:uncharacterized protein LOC109859075 [Pseudomyrmex gracilis]XP_020292535.1 uncharacterized protein LOC109859075 [Pseudomyrmex gracilis]
METDTNISDILRETIAFLESIRDMKLPLALENLRVKLLARSKNTLSAVTRAQGASSPDKPYLDMNSGPKSILLKCESKSEDYVEKEESQKQTYQDYYETFENGIIIVNPTENSSERNDEDWDEDETLIGIYKHLPAVQVRSKCHKCGPLYKKEGKKLFLSEGGRTCWIALIGSYLLIYRSERHNQPISIHSIRGYMARPAPNLIPRDRRRSELAFEIYKPGSETLQFIARTRKDMDQWVARICEIGSCNEEANNKTEEHKIQIVQSSPMSRKNNDTAGRVVKEKSDVNDGTKTKGKTTASSKKTGATERADNAPPLPARIPRRLPSLPPSVSPLDYSNMTVVQNNDDDDDEIYHKIEDLQNEMQYQNLSKKKRVANNQSEIARNESDVGRDKDETAKENSFGANEEIYDDVTLSRINATTTVGQQNNSLNDRPVVNDDETQEDLYDDVENLIPIIRFGKDRAKEDQKIDASPSKLQKKSFLDRVLSRRESSGGKSEKRCKSKTSLESVAPLVSEKMPTYDHVSEPKKEIKELSAPNVEEELPEYNCPPPPRPITPNRANNSGRTEEYYDDVSARREECGNKSLLQKTQDSHGGATDEATDDNAECDDIKILANGTFAEEEIEHYQSPKSGLRVRDALETEQNEELYDDIALWAEFRARQRDVIERKRDNEDNAKSNDKRSWNRFAGNRKSRASDSNCANETNRRSGNENDETENSNEGSTRRNTFQKLISKMKNQSSFSTSKSSTANNNYNNNF